MQKIKTAVDVRTLLFLDIVIMVFMLISGKAEVTLSSFIVAAAVPVITELNLFGNFSFRTGYLKMRCSKSFYLRNLEQVYYTVSYCATLFCLRGFFPIIN